MAVLDSNYTIFLYENFTNKLSKTINNCVDIILS